MLSKSKNRTAFNLNGMTVLLVILATAALTPADGMRGLQANAQTSGPQTTTPARVGTYWLNFSFVDSSGRTLTSFPFQFYVAANTTNNFDGFATSPEVVPKGGPNLFYSYPSVNYTSFGRISGVFQSYKESNGSIPDTAILYTGAPYYGPDNSHYYFILECGFPCIHNGAFVEANSTGVNSYVGWSYYYSASDLRIFFTNRPMYEMQSLSITVNMTVNEAGTGGAYNWTFHPSVDITGARYKSINSTTGLKYVIQTEIQPHFDALSYSLAASVVIIVIASLAFIWQRYKKHHTSRSPPLVIRTTK